MIYDMYPPEDRAKALAVYGTGVMIGPILGPTLGGYLTDTLSWRWVFYVNVPFGLAAAGTLLLLPGKSARNPSLRFDWTGFALIGLTLGALQLMLDRGQDQGWFESSEIIAYASCVALGVYLSAVHLSTCENPFIPRALFRDRSFLAGFFGFLVIGQILNATMAALPPYLQTLGGYTVLDTGLIMSPRGLGTILAMQFLGYASTRMTMRNLLLLGTGLTTATLWYMATWTPDVDLLTLGVISLVQGFGMGILFTPINLSAFATLPAELRTDASVMINLARNLGGAAGIAVSTALIAAETQIAHVQLAAHINPFNRALQTGAPGLMWNPTLPAGAMSISGVVQRQAAIIAYADNFIFLGFVVLSGVLVALLIRTPKTVPTGDAAHLD
jgi:MFS transporter, DHA2 family, multidrug resistance protein